MDLPASPRSISPAERLAWCASVARLAPSKHNAQPWRFVVSDTDLEVWTDESRHLPATDPRGRELALGCGAAAETARIAASALGVEFAVVAWPDGPGGPAARLREAAWHEPTPQARSLLAAVSSRRTDRGPLDAAALPPALPFELADVAAAFGCSLRLLRSEGDQLTLSRVIDLADRQLARRPQVAQEMADWLRLPCDPEPDGVRADATRGSRASYSGAFVQRDFSMPGVPSAHDRPGIDAPLVVVLCTHSDGPVHWLQAGRALMAVLLAVTVAGGSASYLNQPLELQDTSDLLRNDLDLTGHPQVVLRIGAGGPVTPTPRRRVEDVVTVES